MFIGATMLVGEKLLVMLYDIIATLAVEFVFGSGCELCWVLAYNSSNFGSVTLGDLGHDESSCT